MTRCALLFGGMAWWMLIGYGLRDLVVEARERATQTGETMADLLTQERTACACDACRAGCERIPGWFLPGEMEQAAALLGLDPAEFFRRHVTVDYWADVERPVFVLRPRVVTENGGAVAPFASSFGQPCGFYVGGRCAIHAAKPYECAVAHHDGIDGGTHEAVTGAWAGHQDAVASWMGRAPDVPIMNMLDLLSAGLRGDDAP